MGAWAYCDNAGCSRVRQTFVRGNPREEAGMSSVWGHQNLSYRATISNRPRRGAFAEAPQAPLPQSAFNLTAPDDQRFSRASHFGRIKCAAGKS